MATQHSQPGRRKRPDSLSKTQALLSNLEAQIQDDASLRSSLVEDVEKLESGSLDNLERLLRIAMSLENDVNELICDLTLVWNALDAYSAATSQPIDLELSDVISVLMKLVPNTRDWDNRLEEHFRGLYSLKKRVEQH